MSDLGKSLGPLLIVSGLGAVVGSLLLLVSDPNLFLSLIPFLILLSTGLFAFGDKVRSGLAVAAGSKNGTGVAYIGLFVASIYGGYFGAGLGIVLLAIAQIMGHSDFHVANSIKNLLATSFTLLSILVFGICGLIAWPEASVMMVGSTAGGYLGGRYAKGISHRLLKTTVVVFGLVLSLVYFYRAFGT